MERFRRKLRDEKGIAIPFVAVALIVIMALTAVGVETGRLATVATEVQTAADIAATAGARQLFDDPMASPREDAEEVLNDNHIEGTVVSGSHLTELQVGNYTAATGFVANLQPFNAVKSRVEYDVANILLSFLNMPTSHVSKIAVAAFAPSTGGRPTIPIAIGDCLLNEGCLEDSCQPTLTQVPSPDDNSAWTGFFGSHSTSTISTLFPEECNGDPSQVPYIEVGDFINLINGQSVPLLRQVQCMLDHDITEVLVPVVSCSTQFNQSREVLGFARFEILSVRTNGGHKGIDIRGLVSATDGPGGDAHTFGAGEVTMVQ
jgi:hypothetical protein